MRILFVGDGSAGHMMPILAVAQEIKKIARENNLGSTEFFLITDEKFNNTIFQIPIQFKKMKTGEWTKSRFSLFNFANILRLPIAIIQSLWQVYWFMPDVILSKGNIISIPITFAAVFYRIPMIIHEANSIPEVTNRFLSLFAKRVAISFPDTKSFFISKQRVFTGNPVRQELLNVDYKEALNILGLSGSKPVVFIIGGSEVSQKLNDELIKALPELLKHCQVVHQCGIENYSQIKEIVNQTSLPLIKDYHLFAFLLDKLKYAYAAADLVVARAGINVISEIMALGKPSILVPLAKGPADRSAKNQAKNAYYYTSRGAAEILEEPNLKAHILTKEILALLNDSTLRLRLSRNAFALANRDAAKKLAQETLKIAGYNVEN